MSKPFFVTIPNRGLIHLEGSNSLDFLQGLISQNLLDLHEKRIKYGCLLNAQGKFLHDFFIHHGNGFILLDCEGGERAEDLFNRLNKYRLRRNIKISFEKSVPLYGIFNCEIGLADPRHYRMGYRSFEKPEDMIEEGFIEWDKERIMLGVPDGSRDMMIEGSTLLECNLDKFNAIDWNKGCYVGQEVTARMHYRNLGKKHIQTLRFSSPPPAPFSELKINDIVIGQMRSSSGNIGLALIKNEALENLKNEHNNSIRLLGL